jgi:hypothetical protein
MLGEFGQDPRNGICKLARNLMIKTPSNYLLSIEDISWGLATIDEYHDHAYLGKLVTNDPAKRSFALLSCQLQSFRCVLGIHFSAGEQARVNGDFGHIVINGFHDGENIILSPNVQQSLMIFAFNIAPGQTNTSRSFFYKKDVGHPERIYKCIYLHQHVSFTCMLEHRGRNKNI